MRPRLLVNPSAEGRAAGSKAAQVARVLHRSGLASDVVEARSAADATQLARHARDDGVECLAVVGGDTTLHDVIQAYLNDEGAPIAGPDIALVPTGRGADFSRNFGLGEDPKQALQRICTAASRPIDLGIARFGVAGAAPILRAFVNVAAATTNGLTGPTVSPGPAGIGRRAAGLVRTIVDRVAHRAATVMVCVDGCSQQAGPVFGVALANGRYAGRGTMIAPAADPADGALDVIAVYDLARAQGIGLGRRIWAGTQPAGCPGVQIARGSSVELSAARVGRTLRVQLDGRVCGHLPVRVRLVAGALRFRL
jgi:diacylglycerol kinase family enzyme